jgi:hypothetical protein
MARIRVVRDVRDRYTYTHKQPKPTTANRSCPPFLPSLINQPPHPLPPRFPPVPRVPFQTRPGLLQSPFCPSPLAGLPSPHHLRRLLSSRLHPNRLPILLRMVDPNPNRTLNSHQVPHLCPSTRWFQEGPAGPRYAGRARVLPPHLWCLLVLFRRAEGLSCGKGREGVFEGGSGEAEEELYGSLALGRWE